MSQFAALDKDDRVETVTIRGQTIKVWPLKVPQIVPFLKAGGSSIEQIVQGMLEHPGNALETKNYIQLIEQHLPDVTKAIAVALDEEVKVFDELYAAELAELLCAIVSVNLDFFMRQAIPAIGRLTVKILRLARLGSSEHSNAPSPT